MEKPDFLRRGLLHAQGLLDRTGIAALYVKAGLSRGATILMYHSVPDPATVPWVDPRNTMTPARFEKQMQFLQKHRNVVTLASLADMLAAGQEPDPGTVVITFDDGYRDTLEVSAPILARYELPATLFLPTAYINRAQTQWVDVVYCAFLYRTRQVLKVGENEFNLSVSDQAAAAYESIVHQCIVALPLERAALLTSVESQMAPDRTPPRLTMNWDEIRQLRDGFPLFDLGIHTSEHLDLTAHDEVVIRADMMSAIADFQREIGVVPRHVAFPYNRSNEISQRVMQALGFQAALATAFNALIHVGNNPYALPRIEAPASMSLFRFWTSSAWPNLSLALFGRA
ncbi:MAG: polysaccharide deacetylase family protein [Candidatus Hydrogenedentes bacterium]|nr:polysaccharide deacetylase family protein [Candidatus Hydrogenedentota bacterium]